MSTKSIHPIRYVALQTGLKPYLIRAWEERYGAVRPRRSGNRRRLYCDDDVRRLKLLKAAVDCGHNISSVAALGDGELVLVVERAGGESVRVDSLAAAGRGKILDGRQGGVRQVVETALSHIVQLDAVSLEKALGAAAVEMPRQSFLQFVVLPLFQKIGELWRDGKLKIVNEHMASIVVRSMLWDMLRAVEVSRTAPGIVIATPVGHWHELGALASALAASESGWRVYYFGPNLPSEEIVYAVKKLGAKVLALSLCHRLGDNKLVLELMKIRRLAGSSLPLFIGGAGVEAVKETLVEIRAVIVEDLAVFRTELEGICLGCPP